MANSIEFARNYVSVIDKVYQRAAVSHVLNSGPRMVRAGHSAHNVDKIRGDGTFAASIEGLRLLNGVGYGDGGRPITLVYNLPMASLPPDQASMEREFRRRLSADFDVSFTNLVAITNNPSGRWAAALNRKGNLETYMNRLIGAFNPATTAGMMCRAQVSVDWGQTLRL